MGLKIGKILGGIGDVAKVAAPALAFVPGVGPVAAGVAGAVGGALGTLNDQKQGGVGRALAQGAMYGAGGYAAGRTLGGGGSAGLGVGRALSGGGGVTSLAGMTRGADGMMRPARGAMMAGPGGGGRGAMDMLGGVERWLTDPERGDKRLTLLTGALGTAANAYGAAQQGRAADDEMDFERERYGYDRERQERNDALRQQLLNQLMQNLNGGGA